MRRRTLLFFPILVLLFNCLAQAGQIELRQLYAKEKDASEAADALAGVLVATSGRNMVCGECRVEFESMVSAAEITQRKHRDEIVAAQTNETMNHTQARAKRFAAAEQAAAEYAGLRKKASAESLCGHCTPVHGNSRMTALEKEFGRRGAEAVQKSLYEALSSLRKASHAVRRRWYDDAFGQQFDELFFTWMGKPTTANIQLAADCLDGLFSSLVVKNIEPGAHIKTPLKSSIQDIREVAPGDRRIMAFVTDGSSGTENLIFLTGSFFSSDRRGSILIHEESHLLYESTDKGIRQQQAGGFGPPTYKGRSAIFDAYSIEAFIDQLARF